jgi:hypothetical protein
MLVFCFCFGYSYIDAFALVGMTSLSNFFYCVDFDIVRVHANNGMLQTQRLFN